MAYRESVVPVAMDSGEIARTLGVRTNGVCDATVIALRKLRWPPDQRRGKLIRIKYGQKV
jgi:hypothetical protein